MFKYGCLILGSQVFIDYSLLINKMSKAKKRSTRNRIIITKGIDDKSETILITVRIHDCIRGKV